METVKETSTISLRGHVVIRDYDSGEVLLDKHNDINNINMVASIVSAMSNDPTARYINDLALGNGGAIINSAGAINYRSPNTKIAEGTLYNETLRRTISISDSDNNIDVAPDINDENVQDIVVTVTLDYNDADLVGQGAIDNNVDPEGDFIFDELGLVNAQGEFLTHIVFHPIEKSANRKLVIEYTVRFKVGS